MSKTRVGGGANISCYCNIMMKYVVLFVISLSWLDEIVRLNLVAHNGYLTCFFDRYSVQERLFAVWTSWLWKDELYVRWKGVWLIRCRL